MPTSQVVNRFGSNDRLDRNVPIALYYQVSERLREEIKERELRPGDLLSTEEELQRRFQVSRATVRRALEELVDEGLLTRITGKGTYVAEPRLTVQLPMLLSFSEEMRRLGMKPGAQVIKTELTDPSEQAAIHLMVAQGENVLRIERVRYADNAPISYAVDQIPAWVGLSPVGDFSGSLYELLAAIGVCPEESVHTIEAALADKAVAHRLEIPAGSPVLNCHDTTYDATGRPINYGLAIWRADRYSYNVKLKAGKPKPS